MEVLIIKFNGMCARHVYQYVCVHVMCTTVTVCTSSVPLCVRLFQLWLPLTIQCQLCHMTFSDQSAINAHYDTAHAHRERASARFECEICGRKMMHKYDLKRHLATTHNIGDVKTFPCDVCLRVFKRKDHLQRHMNRHKGHHAITPI